MQCTTLPTYLPTDVTKISGDDLGIVNTSKYEYVMTYSFPCQDLSLAGKGGGMTKGNNTRSGLLWEVERLLEELNNLELPQILLMENVIQVIGTKHKADFNKWKNKLASLGYTNFVMKLRSDDFNIPQTRDRVFMLSILGDNINYKFPETVQLTNTLKDVLEDKVDESYYLTYKQLEHIIYNKYANTPKSFDIIKHLNNLVDGSVGYYIDSREFRGQGFVSKSPTLCARDYITPKVVLIKCANKSGYMEAKDGDGLYINPPHQKRGTVQSGMILTLKTSCKDVGVLLNVKPSGIVSNGELFRVRRITPLESFRLMGFNDKYYYKAASVASKSLLYKVAGNSIVVNVLAAIFRGLIF